MTLKVADARIAVMETLHHNELDQAAIDQINQAGAHVQANMAAEQAAYVAPQAEAGVYSSANVATDGAQLGATHQGYEAFDARVVDASTRVVASAQVDPRALATDAERQQVQMHNWNTNKDDDEA